MLNSALDNLKNETSRSALRIEPVSSQGEELYHILRTRLFQTLPDQSVRTEVANDYARRSKRRGKWMSPITRRIRLPHSCRSRIRSTLGCAICMPASRKTPVSSKPVA
jgi:hypothetical protein